MLLALGPDELEICDAAASFLGNEFPLARLHATEPSSSPLSAFAELGWLGLTAPDAAGGSGLSIIEEMLFFRELGRVAGPIEILTQILAVAVAQEDPALCEPLISGKKSVLLIVEERDNGQVRIIGNPKADYGLRVKPDEAVLYQLSDCDCTEIPCLDQSVSMYIGTLADAQPVATVKGDEVWLKAQVDTAAMMQGLAECALAMILPYARERHTFGRPIGAYQAVRHPCADMAVRNEAAKSQLFYAATALSEEQADAPVHINAARVLADNAVMTNADVNIQLHGGIGITDEYHAHLVLKRANLLSRLLGSKKQSLNVLLETNEADS